jgi:diguanylate cyclase (GGDEF)-like protein/PAS domain S-box-containing protein
VALAPKQPQPAAARLEPLPTRSEGEWTRAVALLRATLESTADGILVIDPMGRIVSFNKRFAQMWRLPQELVDSPDDAAVFGLVVRQLNEPNAFLARVQELYDRPETESFDVLESSDGRVFERYSMPQYLDGVAVGRVWTFRDITERRRAEEALRQSEEKYRAILESIEEGYYEVDLDGAFVFANDPLCRLLRASREELLAQDYAAFTDRPTRRRLARAFRAIRDTGRPVSLVEFGMRRRDGSWVQLSASASLIRDSAGRAVGFRGVARDVTERKLAEEELRQSHQFTHQIISSAGEGMIVYDRDLRYVVWNPFMERLTGLSAGQVLGKRPADLFPHTGDGGVEALLQKALQGETVSSPDLPYHVALTGRAGWVSSTYGPHRDASGGIVGVIGIVRDVTERKRSEKLQSALYRIAQVTSAVENMEAFYSAIHSIVAELMYARNFAIALWDETAQALTFPYLVDETDPVPSPDRPLTEQVLGTGQALLASRAAGGSAGSVDWLGVPLKRGEVTFGVLAVQSYNESIRFTGADKEVLTFVSQHVAAAIDRKRAADALRESEAKFRTLADTVPCAIFIYQGGRLRYANAACAAMTGYEREELDGLSLRDIIQMDFLELARQRAAARLRGEPMLSRYELKLRRKDGSFRWVDFSGSVIEFGGQPASLGTAFDITQRKSVEEQIKNIAYHDSLTGLPNRLLFYDRLLMAVAQAHRLGQRLAVLFLDLDRFKLINDSLGHSLGDRLLQAVSERLGACVREGDTVARLGGDEFTLLLPGVARAVDVAKIAEKILEALRQPLVLEGRELFVTSSMGISLYPEDGDDPETLVKNADTAMYRAKDQGRDTYQLYTPAMNATALERLALENSLRKALAQNELMVYYQPVLELDSGHVHGVEALLRWRHPEMGLVSPSDFIPLAEITGLILPIGPWVLRTACAQARTWQAVGHPNLCVSVNISARQFAQGDLAAQVTRVLEETGLQPRYLDLEITESNAMQNADSTVEALRELKALGVRISIDDFGIGYSSLSYLKRLPIDTLKVDQSFVRDITTDPDDATIVTALIAMAHTLKLTVVAEGVESEEQLAFLAARRCDRMQGYLFSHPLPSHECGELLARHRRR